MQTGDVISWQRTFTEEEIRLFAKISGDEDNIISYPMRKAA